MLKERIIGQLKTVQKYFDNSSGCLEEKDSEFTPAADMFTVAQQVYHVAQTVDWFVEGVFGAKGFDLNFEQHIAEMRKVKSLAAARRHLKEAFERAIKTVAAASEEELRATLPPGPVMGGVPREAFVNGLADHTAHHRGALTVYSRLLGKVPDMPYA